MPESGYESFETTGYEPWPRGQAHLPHAMVMLWAAAEGRQNQVTSLSMQIQVTGLGVGFRPLSSEKGTT